MHDHPRPLLEHLTELRSRLFWVIGTWLTLSLLAGAFVRDVFKILVGPAVNAVTAKGHTLIAISPPELFFTYFKTAILAGFLAATPMTLYQIWAFVAPGLYPNERRLAVPFVLVGTLLFASGCLFGYFLAFPQVFEWFLSLEAEWVETAWSTATVFGFMSRLYLAFGLAFELPIVLVFLAIAGIVTPRQLTATRKYAIVINFIVAALLTPADWISQVMLAVPLCVLYEVGIGASWLLVRRREPELKPAAGSTES